MEGTRRRSVWAVCAALVVAAAVLSLLWTDSASTQTMPPGWRCYPAKQPKGSMKFMPQDIVLDGTLQPTTSGQALKPVLYCDPVNAPVNSTTGPGLVCYSIKDDSKFPGDTVEVNSDLFAGQLAVKKSKTFCTLGFGHPVP